MGYVVFCCRFYFYFMLAMKGDNVVVDERTRYPFCFCFRDGQMTNEEFCDILWLLFAIACLRAICR